MRRAPKTVLLAVGVLSVLAAGCGVPEGAVDAPGRACPPDSDCFDPPAAVGDGGAVTITAQEFEFQQVTGAAVEGDVTITLDNIGAAEHNIVIIGANAGSIDRLVSPAATATDGVFNLFAGEYTYYCDIPGHRGAGMEATLVVYASQDEADAATGASGDAEPTDAGEPSEAAEEPSEAEASDAAEEPSDAEASDAEASDAASEG